MKPMRSNNPALFFSRGERARIIKAIDEAERLTSGEIRIHLQRKIGKDILKHAREVFEKIGMAKTGQRNGVLIFMGLKTRQLVILGDKGINERVRKEFWDDTVGLLISHFKNDEFAEGIVDATLKIGEKLKEFFPLQRDDANELSDEISYSL